MTFPPEPIDFTELREVLTVYAAWGNSNRMPIPLRLREHFPGYDQRVIDYFLKLGLRSELVFNGLAARVRKLSIDLPTAHSEIASTLPFLDSSSIPTLLNHAIHYGK